MYGAKSTKPSKNISGKNNAAVKLIQQEQTAFSKPV
jgi:hypothetical protein